MNWIVYVPNRPSESDILPASGVEEAKKRAEDIARFQNGTVYLCQIFGAVAPIAPPFPVEWKDYGDEPLSIPWKSITKDGIVLVDSSIHPVEVTKGAGTTFNG